MRLSHNFRIRRLPSNINRMISKDTDSPHIIPDTVSSKTKQGLIATLPVLPFEAEERTTVNDEMSTGSDHDKTLKRLPQDFVPTPYTVIIGKGKAPKENLGNKRLRVLASNFLTQYSDASDKRTKTRVVNEIIGSIKSAGGSFVRKDKQDNWFQASDQAVREKIGYVFRDLLSDRYRSSSKSKAARRQKEQLGRASLKLERAMRMTYPTLPGMSTSMFNLDALETKMPSLVPSNTMARAPLPSPAPAPVDLSRMVSIDPEPVGSNGLQRSNDIEEAQFSDQEIDDLMQSPLIDPDDE